MPGRALAACICIWFSACSGSDAPGSDAPPADAAAREPGAAAAAAAPAAPAAPAATGTAGDCDLLTQAEVEQAFNGVLTVTRMSGRGSRGSGCTVSIAQGDDSQLILQAGDRAAFDLRRDSYQSQRGVPFEPIDIGEEAYLVNRAQVIAVDASGRSISIGLLLFVFGDPMPIQADAVGDGLRSLAATILDRL